jgi:asparagine synthase (glutamine-hydrolysing)
VTVALTGDGGDELFGGYEVHIAASYANQLGSTASGLRRGLARFSEALPETVGYRHLSRFVKRGLSLAADDWQGVARKLRANLQPDERRLLLSSDALRDLAGNDPFDYLLPRAPSDANTLFDPLQDRMLGDLFLHKTDITSMASGLECRSPFLDVPLSEFARSLPTRFLVRGLSGKRILRDLVSTELDRGLARRRKTGFSPPLDGWLRSELTHLLDDYLGDRSRPVFDLVSYPEVARRVKEHRAGTHNHRRVLWSVMLLEAWLGTSKRSAAHPSGVPASSISA